MKATKYLPLIGLFISVSAFAKTYPIQVTDRGFEPGTVTVAAGEDVTLTVTRITDTTCAKEIMIRDRKLKVNLPLNQAVSVPIGKVTSGQIKFACGMNMIGGVIFAR